MFQSLRSGLIGIAAVLALAAPALGQDNPCPEGQQPVYNTTLERVVCMGIPGSGGSQDARPSSPCPDGQLQVATEDGEPRCIEVRAVPAVLCVPPYRQMTQRGCEWTCGVGTQPDEASGQCQCQPGLVEAGMDTEGRRICAVDPRSLVPVPGRPPLERDPAGTPVLPDGPRPLPIQPPG